MAEWSKALVSGTSHFDGVGSNPTTAIHAGILKLEMKKIMIHGKKLSYFNVYFYFSLLMLLRNN